MSRNFASGLFKNKGEYTTQTRLTRLRKVNLALLRFWFGSLGRRESMKTTGIRNNRAGESKRNFSTIDRMFMRSLSWLSVHESVHESAGVSLSESTVLLSTSPEFLFSLVLRVVSETQASYSLFLCDNSQSSRRTKISWYSSTSCFISASVVVSSTDLSGIFFNWRHLEFLLLQTDIPLHHPDDLQWSERCVTEGRHD